MSEFELPQLQKPRATWSDVEPLSCIMLNFGSKKDYHPKPVFKNWIGVDKAPNRLGWCVCHNLRHRIPLQDNTVAKALSEHTIEHMRTEAVQSFFSEVYRTLKPGGTFRVSCPDCGNPITKRLEDEDDADDTIKHVHISRWTCDKVVGHLSMSGFVKTRRIEWHRRYYHFCDYDESDGYIKRGRKRRRDMVIYSVGGPPCATSVIVDATK